jgi:PLP dependent protein
MLRDNLARVQDRIEEAAKRSGRGSKDVTLVAVTKKVTQDKILEAIALGVRHIGESYVQEAVDKAAAVKIQGVLWHMIGHLQSNKAAKAAEIFDVIQSADSFKLLGALDRKAGEAGKKLSCYLELKLSDEPNKTGLSEGELEETLFRAKELKRIQIGGIMMMAPFFADPQSARPYFKRAKTIFDRLFFDKGAQLSMGMSGDFEVAVEEGSTLVRIGQALFGERA